MTALLPPSLTVKAADVLDFCQRQGLTVAVAESCTGGLVMAALTSQGGSSAVVERGFVTYSNDAKIELLGVPPRLLNAHGAVSAQVARAMAEGVLAHSPAGIAAAVTGIAGPGGATPDKPVGTVHLAAIRRDGQAAYAHHVFAGDRDAVRLASALTLLDMVLEAAKG